MNCVEFCRIPLSIVLAKLHRVLATNYRSDKPVSSKHTIVCTVRSWGQELCSIVCFGETVCSSSQFVLLTANMIQFQFQFLFQISWVRQTNADNSKRTAITFAFVSWGFFFFLLISLEMFVSHYWRAYQLRNAMPKIRDREKNESKLWRRYE